MHIREIYQAVYRRLDTLTPLSVDCGALCGKLCCQSPDGEDAGMYLFPGEESLFWGLDGFYMLDSALTYAGGKSAKLLCCTQPCQRSLRPLSCRIFPLVPYYRRESGVRIIFDPRARFCPLSDPSAKPYLERDFKLEVWHAFRLLSKISEVAAFLEALTDVLDDFTSLRGTLL